MNIFRLPFEIWKAKRELKRGQKLAVETAAELKQIQDYLRMSDGDGRPRHVHPGEPEPDRWPRVDTPVHVNCRCWPIVPLTRWGRFKQNYRLLKIVLGVKINAWKLSIMRRLGQ